MVAPPPPLVVVVGRLCSTVMGSGHRRLLLLSIQVCFGSFLLINQSHAKIYIIIIIIYVLSLIKEILFFCFINGGQGRVIVVMR